jgi:hypothetical protein
MPGNCEAVVLMAEKRGGVKEETSNGEAWQWSRGGDERGDGASSTPPACGEGR